MLSTRKNKFNNRPLKDLHSEQVRSTKGENTEIFKNENKNICHRKCRDSRLNKKTSKMALLFALNSFSIGTLCGLRGPLHIAISKAHHDIARVCLLWNWNGESGRGFAHREVGVTTGTNNRSTKFIGTIVQRALLFALY